MVSKVVAWMDEVEKAVLLKEVLPAKYDANSPLIKCAIFFWGCKILKVGSTTIRGYPTTLLKYL
jgi:hypothetical protein